MNTYIATFHTHLAALRTHRALISMCVGAQLAPVPRYLSSSCGTCVRYAAEHPHLDRMDSDVERVVMMVQDESYAAVFENE